MVASIMDEENFLQIFFLNKDPRLRLYAGNFTTPCRTRSDEIKCYDIHTGPLYYRSIYAVVSLPPLLPSPSAGC
jgi:hypothetical protein